ncbi:MAG: putative lipopolysaccharide heptosyltransferase III [Chlamydiales bacterium]|nr:putative lipopolysaccharide heptosyltransferase III [Chlamydiales bacterium]
MNLTKIKKILVIKLRHHGDVLMATPVFQVLQKRMPQAQIDAYIYAETKPMLEGHPSIQDFILYDKSKKTLISELKRLWRIRKNRYDLVINLTEGDRGAVAAWVSGAKVRVGVDPEGTGMWGKSSMYTHLCRNCPNPRHAVERGLDVLRVIGIFPKSEERELFFKTDSTYTPPLDDYVLIHPVSRWMFKSWPAEKMAKLIHILAERGEKIILTSSPSDIERQMLTSIELLCPNIEIINLGGKTSLKELGTLIKNAKLLITVDSVPLHIASALKAPCLAIFGPTSEVNWAPYRNPNARVVAQNMPCRPCYRAGCADSGRSDCLETLEVSAVVDELKTLCPL